MELNSIERTIQPLLERYNEISSRLLHSDVRLIGDITSHLYARQGKQLRPLLTLLSAAACGMPTDAEEGHPVFRVAAAIELLHNATLLHDDVVDESPLRRGQPSVNQQWGNKTAVLMGDYLLAHVMHILFQLDNDEVTDLVNEAVTQMSEGELLQQQCSGNLQTDADTYLRIIRQKTALLLSASCRAGALLATDNKEWQAALTEYGMQMGIAFQIRDDLLDFLPADITGKPQGNDLHERKITLPLILAMKEAGGHNKEIFSALIQQEMSDQEVQRFIRLIAESGALQATAHIEAHYIDAARKPLKRLPPTPFRDALESLAEQLTITTETLKNE